MYAAILLKIPKTKDAVNHLATIGHKWCEIGIALEVTHSEILTNICIYTLDSVYLYIHSVYLLVCACVHVGRLEEIKEKTSNVTRLSNVISCWKDQSADDATWGELIEAVKGPIVNSRLTAKNMREFLKNPKTLRNYGCL